MNVTSGQDLESRFRTEYPAAADKLAAAASKVGCTGRITSKRHVYEDVFDVEFYVNADRMLGVFNYELVSNRPATRSDVRCLTPDYFFQLTRPTPDKPFIVKDVVKGTNMPTGVELSMRYRLVQFVQAAFSITHVPVIDLIAHRSFRILAITESQLDAENGPRVDVRFKCSDPTHWIGGGRMTFAPGMDWALESFEVQVVPGRPGIGVTQHGATLLGNVRCRSWAPGFVFPEEGEFRFNYPANDPKTTEIELFRFSHAKPSEVPESRFKLSAFGIPDTVLEPAASDASSLSMWFLVLGILCLVLTVAIRAYLASRRMRLYL
jgi:hypothetical protein